MGETHGQPASSWLVADLKVAGEHSVLSLDVNAAEIRAFVHRLDVRNGALPKEIEHRVPIERRPITQMECESRHFPGRMFSMLFAQLARRHSIACLKQRVESTQTLETARMRNGRDRHL